MALLQLFVPHLCWVIVSVLRITHPMTDSQPKALAEKQNTGD